MSDIIRYPVRAGSFYPDDPSDCLNQARNCTATIPKQIMAENILGGIVPHAGWPFSGKLAGAVFRTIKEKQNPDIFVILGTTHYYTGDKPAIYDKGVWRTPIGDLMVDQVFSEEICTICGDNLIASLSAHENEHSIEVQLPLIQVLFPESRIVPILVPPVESVVEFGSLLAKAIVNQTQRVVLIGSTDLTHYGLNYYGFGPAGVGQSALEWEKENDLRVINLILKMNAEDVMIEALSHHNACGPGAISATIAAVRSLGSKEGILLEHTTSYNVLPKGTASNFVGYAAIVFPE